MEQDYSEVGLRVCYHRAAPPSIGVDGSNQLGGGPHSCDDAGAVVAAASSVGAVVVSR
jgi:hypothetical protein